VSLSSELNPENNFDHDNVNFFITKALQSQNILTELSLSEGRRWYGEALTMIVSSAKRHPQILALFDSFGFQILILEKTKFW
jgi:hypothetical protein